jgi:acyl-CoA thioesterase YciA
MEITESSVSPARESVFSAYGTISRIAKSRTVTVAIEAMNFRKPVFVGDLVSVHASLVKIGKTSIVHLEAWVLRRKEMHSILVTDVAIDDQGHPQVIAQGDPPITA